jgi:hypothetical protein
MDILIAVGSFFAAIYATLPRHRQLDLQLRLGRLDLVILLIGSLTVIYLQFYDFFETRGINFAPLARGLTPANTTCLALLAMAAWLAARLRFARLSVAKMPKFRQLLEELYWSNSFGESFSLLQNCRIQLFDIYHRRTFVSRHPTFA